MNRIARQHLAAFLVASSTALGLVPAASAQEPRMGMGHHGGPMMQLRGLDLSDAQRDQVFKIFHEQAPAAHEQMKQMHSARQELMKLAAADRFDEARARQAADLQAKALSALALQRAQTMHRVREILTPEQRQRLDERTQRRGHPHS
jgi:periplasmic protein CpxP/Spy